MTAESDFVHKLCDERMAQTDVPALQAENAALQAELLALKAENAELKRRIMDLEAEALKRARDFPIK